MPAPTPVNLVPDANRGGLWSGSITLSATPSTATTVVVPVTANGFRVFSNLAILRVNIGEAPDAVTDVATTDQDAVASDEYKGGYIMPGMWEVRLLEPYNANSNATRVLHITSVTASATLYFEFF